MINGNKIRQIVDSLDILKVAQSRGLELSKKGSNYVCLSPWTNEKTPSCFFSVKKNIFKDFSSGKGGDMVTFIEEFENVEFVEAIKILAELAGITIEDERPEVVTEKQRIQQSNYVLQHNLFKFGVKDDKKNKAIKDLAIQRFGLEMVKKFALGYWSKPDNGLTELMQKSGLISEKGYPLMKDRLIFPVRSKSGTIITFCGRSLIDKQAKYLNGRETLIFKKSETLYGVYESRLSISQKDHGLLVEGNPDVITCHKYGYDNSVCPLGTSLTESQVGAALRMTKNWTIIFDGDPAGIKATNRAVKLFLDQGVEPKVLVLPYKEDPDSYLQQNLKFDFKDQVGGIQFLANSNPELDSQFFDVLVKFLESIENPHLKNIKALQLAEQYGLSVEFIEVRKKWKQFSESEEFYSSHNKTSLLDIWLKNQVLRTR